MKIHSRTLTGCTVVVTLLLAACEMPRPRPGAAEGTAAPGVSRAGKAIDPSSSLLDLEGEGLTVEWRQDIGQIAGRRRLRGLYLVGDRLLAETWDGTVFHFKAATGEWTAATRLKSVLTAPPAMQGNDLYLPTVRHLLVVDRESGLTRKTLPHVLPVCCQPLPFDKYLILAGANGEVACIDTDEGIRMWPARSADGAIMARPLLSQGIIYAAGHKGRVVAISLRSGDVLWDWRPPAPSKIVSGLTLADGFLYVGDDRGFVRCLMSEGPNVIWTYPAGAPVCAATVPVAGKLLVFTYGGDALCLQLGDEPSLLWRHHDGERLIATGKRDAYILTRGGSVACVELESGEEKWRLPLGDECVVASDPSQSTFYVGQRTGAIMAVRELK